MRKTLGCFGIAVEGWGLEVPTLRGHIVDIPFIENEK